MKELLYNFEPVGASKDWNQQDVKMIMATGKKPSCGAREA